MNAQTYIETFDFTKLIKNLFKNNEMPEDDNHFGRHNQEVKKYLELFKKSNKRKEYFKEMPTLDTDLSSFVILTNIPFVEKEKQEKFKELIKKLAKNFSEKIKEFIFAYEDSDKEKLKNTGVLILKFDSYEEAKMASAALQDVSIAKNKINAPTVIEFDKIINLDNEYKTPALKSFVDLVRWEEGNLTEMCSIKFKDRISIFRLHYLKKELLPIFTINNENILSVRWSPQGRFFIINKGDHLRFYGGNSMFDIQQEIDINIKDYSISTDEKYVCTFSGYGENSEENQKVKENLFIWDLAQNELVRGFGINKEEKFENLKWSQDSKYLARLKKDILIVYAAPSLEMLQDSQGVKQPIKDKIKEMSWFPTRNTLLTVTEKLSGKKISETIIQFFDIPSRKTFPASVLSGLEIFSLEWHKNNTILAVICKTPGDNNQKYSIRIFDFEFNKLTYRSATSSLPTDNSYKSISVKWLGNDLFVVPKYKDNNLDTMNIFPYKLEKKSLKIEPWAGDKFLKNLKHSDFIPSPDGLHFLAACLDTNNSNSFGRVDLYAIFDESINFCRSFEFTNNCESIKWDISGRLFMVQINRKTSEAVKFFDAEGNPIYDLKDGSILNTSWRNRHSPMLQRVIEEEDIKKNFKNLSKIYEEEDSEFLSAIEKQRRAEQKKIRESFMAIVNRRRALWNERKLERENLYKEPEEELVEVECIREEILHTFEEIIKTD